VTIARSFSPNSAQDGRQVCRPAANFSVTQMQEENSWIMLFSSCILVTLKLAAGRQTCRPAHAELGLKDWTNNGTYMNLLFRLRHTRNG
jgi:hypothetical protein